MVRITIEGDGLETKTFETDDFAMSYADGDGVWGTSVAAKSSKLMLLVHAAAIGETALEMMGNR